jgi:hypothetical protein
MSIQLAAFALADFLLGASPGAQPFRAVVFLLGVAGHTRAGVANPRELNRRSHLLAKGINTVERTKKGLDYDPVDVIEFNSFDELLGKRPPGGALWQEIVLVTHGSGEQPGDFTGEIFFGKEIFAISRGGINDLLDAINAKSTRVNRFRAGFADPANITLIGCGIGATGPDVAIYVRELFGTEGQVLFTTKNVDFFPNGLLGTPKDPENPVELRRLKPEEWRVVPRKDDILNAADAIRP